MATILRTSPTLLIPIVIVGTILGGLANATESAAVGAVAAALVGKFWTREFEFSQKSFTICSNPCCAAAPRKAGPPARVASNRCRANRNKALGR